MKDSLGNLFRERFHGHEVPVAPGTWQAIQGQLATAVPVAQEPAPGHLQEKFNGHEVHVDPAVWQNISAQIGQGVTAGATSGGFFGGLGWAAAGITGLLIAGGLMYTLNTDEPVVEQAKPRIEVVEQVNAPVAETTDPIVVPPTTINDRPEQAETAATASKRSQRNIISQPDHREPAVVPEQPAPTAPADMDNVPAEDPRGVEVVQQVIAEMTEEVEQAVLANPSGVTPAGTNSAPAPTPETAVAGEPEGPGDVASLCIPLIPNVFTPNGDGINEAYQVDCVCCANIKIRVFSVKSNQLVFSSNANDPWTGANCEDGMYMVAVEATTTDGRMVSEGKVVWLTRNSTN